MNLVHPQSCPKQTTKKPWQLGLRSLMHACMFCFFFLLSAAQSFTTKHFGSGLSHRVLLHSIQASLPRFAREQKPFRRQLTLLDARGFTTAGGAKRDQGHVDTSSWRWLIFASSLIQYSASRLARISSVLFQTISCLGTHSHMVITTPKQ